MHSGSGRNPARFVPKDDYLSKEFVRLEARHLWPRVWQVACRTEEIPAVGDFIIYDVADESLIVMRIAVDRIKAYHNSCPHRGRRLMDGAGRCSGITCPFHGWQWDIDGNNVRVVDKDDWRGGLRDEDIRLKEAQVGTWGGCVFVNMDPRAQPLETFIAPIIERCGKYEFEKLRFRWYKTVILPCNWKIALEAFNEAYHAQTTHPQVLQFVEDYTNSGSYGLHGAFWYPLENGKSLLTASSRLNQAPQQDHRQYILTFVEQFNTDLKAMVTPRAYEATQRLRTEVAADASAEEVLTKWLQFQQEAAEADGAGWPALSAEDMMRSHFDWHMFPNSVFLHSSIDGVLWYRARPNGDDPGSCVFDIWSLVRYPPAEEPPLVREFYANWREHDWGRILNQDFRNLEKMQRGIKSMGFTGSRTNPVQEQPVSNFHRAVREVIAAGMRAAAAR